MTPQNLFIDVDGHKIRYWQCGQGPSTILLLHGFALSCEIWKNNIPALAQKHRVIALDILGFGQSDVPAEKLPDLDHLPKFIHRFMQCIGVEKAHVVGHSMGGLLSLKLAASHPQAVERLVLVGSAGFKRNIPFHFRIFSLPILGELMIRPNRLGLGHALKHNAYLKDAVSEELIEALYEYTKHPGRGKFYLDTCRKAINICGFKSKLIKTVKQDAADLKSPVLLLWGKQDPIVYLKHGLYAQKMIANSKMVVFEECGHLPQLEKSDAFNKEILNFIHS